MTALEGQLAVVTGASRGIGQAIAQRLRQSGAKVVGLSRGGDVSCDVRDAGAVSRAAARILGEHGAPDLLVTAAGTFIMKPLRDTTSEEFEDQLATNLTGTFAMVRAFAGAMMKRGRGLIVAIGSIADHEAFPGNAAYAASKFGVRGLFGVLRAELAGSGVRATLLSPGPVNTALWDEVDPDNREGFTPRRDMLHAEDVAEAVVWLATRPSRVAIPELMIEPVR